MYRYQSFNNKAMRLKLEINTRDHLHMADLLFKSFLLDTDWFTGTALISTYCLEELMAKKLKALYQRRKGRDLFDLHYIFSNNLADVDLCIDLFYKYCAHEGASIKRKLFQQNMKQKQRHRDFQTDMDILLPHGTTWDFNDAFEYVLTHIISKIR